MSAGRGLVSYKRWRLREGVTVDQVAQLVANHIVPHYRLLSTEVVLGLEDVGDDTVLALQRWPSRASRDEAMSGEEFERWWQDYLPILAHWDALVEFEAEWEGEVIF